MEKLTKKTAEQLSETEPTRKHEQEIWALETAVQDFLSHTAAAYFPNRSLCVPVRVSVSTSTSSSVR